MDIRQDPSSYAIQSLGFGVAYHVCRTQGLGSNEMADLMIHIYILNILIKKIDTMTIL